MTTPIPFYPKQSPPRSPVVLDAIQGDVTKQVVRHAFTLAPPIDSSSIIHDNACGTGAVTEVILEKTQPAILHATDFIPPFVQVVSRKAGENGWTFVQTAAMDAMDLRFPDNTFTHSITNFCIQVVPQPLQAVREIYRTVLPGKTAILTSWAPAPHSTAVQQANKAIRGENAVLQIKAAPETETAAWLQKLLEDGGFSRVNVEKFTGYCTVPDVKLWCTYVWSFMGAPVGGWTPRDEEDWDKAVAEMMESLQGNPEVQYNGDGSAVIKMVAHVAVATK